MKVYKSPWVSRLHRFRLCWLYTTENIMEENDYEYCPNCEAKGW